jgi:hypothetical protein
VIAMAGIRHDVAQWRPCPGFPEYAVSENGEVKRVRGGTRTAAERMLRGHRTNSGYVLVNLAPNRNRKRALLTHRLVCEAWHGPPPPGRPEVDHIDRNRLNNHPSNLRWVSRAENQANRSDRQAAWPELADKLNGRGA